jgi:sterol desaturase/sphingolipid hydroxylase (fatty acid hydroxylase superfamily)
MEGLASLLTHYTHTLLNNLPNKENFLPTFVNFLYIAVPVTFVELLFPAERQSWSGRVRGVLFWVPYVVVGGTILVLSTRYALPWLGIGNFSPLIIDLTWTKNSTNPLVVILGYTICPFAGLFVGDFFYYWFHRMQHKIGFLWYFHKVHHSIEEVSVTNSYSHVSEHTLSFFLMVVPMALLVRIHAPDVALLTFVFTQYGILVHANTNISYHFAKYFIAEPRFHRIHHSLEPRHFNKNYVAIFPVWDMIFGTAYWPEKDELPKTGLSDLPQARGLIKYLFPPPSQVRR